MTPPPTQVAPGVRIVRADPSRVDDLKDLCLEMWATIGAVEVPIDGMPMRSPDALWQRRRANYLEWLENPGSFALIAEEESSGDAVGYSFVTLNPPFDAWDTGEPLAELESLAVTETWRRRGVGAALMRETHRHLRGLGVATLLIGVVHENADAIRFYEREGFSRFAVQLMGAIPVEEDA